MNHLTAKMLAVVAEEEGRLISERTRSALAPLKVRGVKLGAARLKFRNLTPAARLKGSRAGAAVRQAEVDDTYADLHPLAMKLRGEGKTPDGIASRLNDEDYTTTTGKPWGKVQVKRLLGRAALLRFLSCWRAARSRSPSAGHPARTCTGRFTPACSVRPGSRARRLR